MEEYIKILFEQEKKKRNLPLEVKKIGNNYYLYTSTTVWLPGQNKRKKISTYIGKFTKDGVVEGTKTKRVVRSIYEYGNAKILFEIANEILPSLKEAFEDEYGEILAMAIVKTIQPTPLKLIKSVWEKLYLARELDVSLSPNVLSERLKYIGAQQELQFRFFKHLMSASKYLIFDLSSIVSYSENLVLAEKGYNAQHYYHKQINLALMFSADRRVPVMMRVLPGSVRDIKTFRHLIESVDLGNSVFILDRGFASYNLSDLMNEKRIGFVLPLRRNFKLIDYKMPLNNSFAYRKRGIRWGRKTVKGGFLYLYEDVKLRAEEETTFIEMIQGGRKTSDQMQEQNIKFGKIAILSNIEEDGEKIYLMYKQREEVEVAFDTLKNELENDKTYLSDEDAVRGYFFISFLTLYFYFNLLERLRQISLIGKMSPQELLMELSKVYLVSYSDEEMKLSEIPDKVEKIDKELNLNLFPKILRS